MLQEKIFSLPIITSLSSTVSLHQWNELPILVINHVHCRAAISLQGAQLLAWQPTGEQPVIWLSEASEFTAGVPIRGGVPLCWPWFGPAGKPLHGFARNLLWTLSEHQANDQNVTLTLTLTESAQSLNYWPHPFTLVARFTLGHSCNLVLESQGDYQAQAALHSYFTVGDISKITVSGLGERYIDKVQDGAQGQQQGDLRFTGRTDRIYTDPESVSLIHDAALQRTIEIHHHHASDVIAWNPGAELSASMADMMDEGYQTMVCVETGRVSQPLQATPQHPATIAMTLRCRRMS